MKFSHGEHGADAELDDIDRHLLVLLQEDCRTSYARLGEQVGLSAPAVLERIKKLEVAGVIVGYHAAVDARSVGLDVTAFIGVITDSPDSLARFEEQVLGVADVLECHHVTGEYTLLLKVKTASTSSLERLISRIRALDGVARTETTVVLSTLSERATLPLATAAEPRNAAHGKRSRRNGAAVHETHARRA
jgi:Lrp/AsnC family leucine-responsive transcriptional regulator